MRGLSLFIPILILCFGLQAQNKFSDNLSLEGNYGIGYIMPEYQFINYVVEDYARNIELLLVKQTTGKTDWEQAYNYPKYGLRFYYADLGSPSTLGYAAGLYPYYNINLAEFNRFKVFHEAGLGVNYVSKKFDLNENFLNVAVGSNWNFHLNIRFGLNYEVNPKLSFNSAISLDHFSNANTQEPNLGINYLLWTNGFSYKLGTSSDRQVRELTPLNKIIEKELAINIGGKHTRELSSQYYLTNSLSYEIRKQYSRAFKLGVGADFFFDSSVKDQLEDEETSFKNSNYLQTGIHIAKSLVYSRLSFTLQTGIYLGFTEKVKNNTIYNRGIIKYQVSDLIAARLSMKSHLHILDYPELGISFKL